MWKWIKRIFFGLIVVTVLAVLFGLSYEQWSRMNAANKFLPPGELIDVEERKAHINCTGSGSPTVILEAGLDPFGSLVWTDVQPGIANITRVCSYDRAGIMWSDSGREPRDGQRIASELHALLETSSESPPYVMVGHSLGGLFQRLYDAHYPGEAAGFVFVDSSHPEQMERLPDEVVEFMEATQPPVLLTKVLSRLGVIRLTGQVQGELLPEQVQAAVRGLAPESVEGLIGEMVVVEETLLQAQATGHLGSRPIIVLSAGNKGPPPGMEVPPEVKQSIQSTWPELQEEIRALSTNSERRIIENSGHYIQIEASDAVIAAVVDVVKAVREGKPIGVEGSHGE